jgi:hypothetical protein
MSPAAVFLESMQNPSDRKFKQNELARAAEVGRYEELEARMEALESTDRHTTIWKPQPLASGSLALLQKIERRRRVAT